MKKIAKVFALTVMLVIGGQAMAQYRGAMFLGASFPMNSFGDFDGFNEYALMRVEESDAGAAIGFNAGIKWYFNVGVEGLNAMVSVDGFYNGINSNLKTAFRESESNYNGLLLNTSFKYDATPKYFNFPAMLGVNYIYHFNPNLGIYVEAGAGGNFRLITDLEAVAKGQSVLGQEVTQRDITDYDNAITFAYQAGIGFEIAKNLVIGCSFYDLGKADVSAELIHKEVINQEAQPEAKEYKTYGNVHPVMVVGRIGFSF